MNSVTDRIEKKVFLKAPQARVWQAICDSKRFGAWFGVTFDAPFAPGVRMVGTLTGTTVDPATAKRMEDYKGARFEFEVARIEPEHHFSYRWHPFALDADVDYSSEPMTLVAFDLQEAPGGTMLTIVESGFDAIPLARRADAFEANDEGWAAQAEL
ncbi:MAG TPA: SRPBCC family protein, partial [Candidatus Acidoferrales bacterium]|nr:SRPBCC family protein [Candidatus Acidoferrales bacterium]